MTAPPERILQKVRQWAAYGDEDICLAQQAVAIGLRVRDAAKKALDDEGVTL
ncbi:MAG: hypothetical protein KAV82_07460 [Phycisphaerae bacterium]|nr:hypothetical protein [Phycisphaerae bacterium]